MTIVDRLVADLESDLIEPVRPPGSSVGAMPCVTVRPADDLLELGRYVVHGYVVSAMVSRDGTVAQLATLETFAMRVLESLVSHGYRVGNRHRYVGGDAEDVNYLAREFPVEVDGEVFC